MIKNRKQILILLAALFLFPAIAEAMKMEWSITEYYGIGENPVCAIAEDGDTYGIALIAPTDPDYGDAQHDSGVRIQTSAGQMALMRYQ